MPMRVLAGEGGAVSSSSSDAPTLPARVIKKRETDRQCQRRIRERTKAHTIYLESLVDEFRQQDNSGRVEALMKQIEHVRHERDILEGKLKNIETVVLDRKRAGDSTSSLRQRDSALKHDPPEELQSTRHSPSERLPPTKEPIPDPPSLTPSWRATPGDKAAGSSTTWQTINSTLTSWFDWPTQSRLVNAYDPLNEDILMRAVVEGWDKIGQHGPVSPLWTMVRDIDQTVLTNTGIVERMALVRIISTLLATHLNPTHEHMERLPVYYRVNPPNAATTKPSYAVDFIPYPGVRAEFAQAEHRYSSNKFWRIIFESLRIQWPYEVRDCYTRNKTTGMYMTSPIFLDCINNIGNWAVGRELFQTWPELYGLMPSWNHIPASVDSMSSRDLPKKLGQGRVVRQRRSSRVAFANFTDYPTSTSQASNVEHPTSLGARLPLATDLEVDDAQPNALVSLVPQYPMHNGMVVMPSGWVPPLVNNWNFQIGLNTYTPELGDPSYQTYEQPEPTISFV